MPKSVLGLRVGWIDFGRFGGPIDFSLLRFFLSTVVEREKEMKNNIQLDYKLHL